MNHITGLNKADGRLRIKLNHVCKSVLITAGETSGSAMAEGPRNALVSRNSATTKYSCRMALFA